MAGGTRKVQLNDRHTRLAGRILKMAMRELGNDSLDAQLTLTVMCMYMCMNYQMKPDQLLSVLKQNMLLLGRHETVHDVLNAVYAEVEGKKSFTPGYAGVTSTEET